MSTPFSFEPRADLRHASVPIAKHDHRTADCRRYVGPGKVCAPYFPLRRSNRGPLRAERKGAGILGVFEETIEGTRPGGSASAGVSHESQLPARLHAGADRGGVSGRGVVSLLHDRGAGADHSATLDAGNDCGGVCICKEPAARLLSPTLMRAERGIN